jgi:hypothetical protein
MESLEKIVIDLKNGKSAILTIIPFDSDIDTNDLTTIHSHNIMGEILTSSNLLNRVGNLKAEQENILAVAELDFKIWQAHHETKMRKELTSTTEDAKGNSKVSKPTIDEVNAAVLTSPEYRVKMQHLLNLRRDGQVINAFYWAVKSKDDKLVKLSEKLVPGEFEKHLVEERVNDVLIRVNKNLIN